MTVVVTVLDAYVAPDRVADLQAAYGEAGKGLLPPGLVRSALLRHSEDPTHWRIETVWQSREALVAMRAAGRPRGLQIFEAAGAAPTVSVFDTVATIQANTQGARRE